MIVNVADIKVTGTHIGTLGEYWFKIELLTPKAVEYWGWGAIGDDGIISYDPENLLDRMFSDAIKEMVAYGLIVDFTPLAGV